MQKKLGERQEEFMCALGVLIVWAYENGYRLRPGDTYPHRRHRPGSYHETGLAIDLHLFKDGVYQTASEDHAGMGEFWESLGGSWGGRWGDGNHYSWGESKPQNTIAGTNQRGA